jgi:predicted dehydrogenase
LPIEEPIRVAVIGTGTFGRNHARVYSEMRDDGVELAALVDREPGQAEGVLRELQAEGGAMPQIFTSVEEMLEARLGVKAASVAVPTTEHLAVARSLMHAGIDVLVEKPIARTLAEADELVTMAQQFGRVAQAGHLERFNPAVRAALPLVGNPMFFEVHRLSLFSSRALDVDVVLDLMIHDLDIVLSLAKSEVREIRAVGIAILSNKVDIANVRMEFESGCVANFTASRVSTERVRKLRLFQPHQYISLDYSKQDVFALTVEPASSFASPPVANFPPITMPPGMRIVPSRPAVQSEEPLRAELRAFLEAVRSRSAPEVTLQDGRRALAVALEILSQIEQHARRVNLGPLAARG